MVLLIAENDGALARSLARSSRGDLEIVVATRKKAFKRLDEGDVDAVIVDLEDHGLAVVDYARSHHIHAPILILSARDAVKTSIEALEHGADGILIKPFEHEELRARLQALLRSAAAPRLAQLMCNGLVYRENDPPATMVGNERVVLSPREHRLLGLLLRRQGVAIARSEIWQEVFGYEFQRGTNTMAVHIGNLRRKLGTRAVVIETVRGIGYRLRAARAEDASSGS